MKPVGIQCLYAAKYALSVGRCCTVNGGDLRAQLQLQDPKLVGGTNQEAGYKVSGGRPEGTKATAN